jgi:hypothetical protein
MNGQTYATHVHQPRFWSISLLAGFIGFLLMAVFVIRQPSLTSVGLLLMSFALVGTTYLTRRFALSLQDRIIRIEMQTRLARLGREGDLARLSMRQIVALRFASDAEMPALIDRAIAEKLSSDQIKRAVTNWQGDYLRT